MGGHGFEEGSPAAPGMDDAAPARVIAMPQLGEIRRRETITMRGPGRRFDGAAGGFVSLESEGVVPAAPITYDDLYLQARQRSEAAIAEAQRTAAQMVDQARQMRDSELESARRAGYEAGYADGIEAADRETAGLVATVEQMAVSAARERDALVAGAEADIVRLAIAIAERIVNSTIELEPERVVDICRAAMRKAFQRETLSVLAHPEDIGMLRASGPQLATELGGVQHLEFVEERRLSRGSIIVRTPAGEIDATFRGKAARIEEALCELADTRRAQPAGEHD